MEEIRADNYIGKKANKKEVRIISEMEIDNLWKNFIEGKSKEQIAFDLMKDYIIDGKKISKAVIAMNFSSKLESISLSREDLLVDDNPIQYLIDAIKYATRN